MLLCARVRVFEINFHSLLVLMGSLHRYREEVIYYECLLINNGCAYNIIIIIILYELLRTIRVTYNTIPINAGTISVILSKSLCFLYLMGYYSVPFIINYRYSMYGTLISAPVNITHRTTTAISIYKNLRRLISIIYYMYTRYAAIMDFLIAQFPPLYIYLYERKQAPTMPGEKRTCIPSVFKG